MWSQNRGSSLLLGKRERVVRGGEEQFTVDVLLHCSRL